MVAAGKCQTKSKQVIQPNAIASNNKSLQYNVLKAIVNKTIRTHSKIYKQIILDEVQNTPQPQKHDIQADIQPDK